MLVQVAELETYLGGIELTVEETEFVQNIVLPGVQQELETYLNRPVEPVHVREPRMPNYNGDIILSVSPVWRVNSVDFLGVEQVTPSIYVPPPITLDPIASRTWDAAEFGMSGTPWMQGGSGVINVLTYLPLWGMLRNPGYVVVDYVGGYNGYVDTALKLSIARVAAREVERNFDRTLTIKDGSYDPADASDGRPKGWTREELDNLSRLKRRVISV